MAISDEVQKAFDFAAEFSKQVLTLSAGIITITISLRRFIYETASEEAEVVLLSSWGCLVVSIASGLMALMNMTGNLERPGTSGQPSVYAPGIVLFVGLQFVFFFIGMLLIVLFAFNAEFCSSCHNNCLCRLTYNVINFSKCVP